MEISPRLYSDLVGKPFVNDGRGPDAYDCVGLLLEMQRRLGHVGADYASDVGAVSAIAEADWERVGVAQPGDAILLRSSDPKWHVAVVIGPGRMIHSHPAAGVCLQRFDITFWKRCVEGFYRWKKT